MAELVLPIFFPQPLKGTTQFGSAAQGNACGGGKRASEMDDTCIECGAPAQDGMNCWEQLGGILAWEAQDAELAGEHFFTVACYNIQHPAQFTDEAIEALRQGFVARTDKGLSTGELRRQMSNLFEGNKRVLKREAERRPALRKWGMTIADVYLPEQPEGAAERVRHWAQVIRDEM